MTDHSSLTWLLGFKNIEGELIRWIEELSLYNMHIVHRARRKHVNYGLFRIPDPLTLCNCYSVQTQDELDRYVRSSTCVAVGEIGLDYTRVRSANERDLQLEVFGRLCEVGKPVVIILTQNLSWANQVYWHHCSGYAAEAHLSSLELLLTY